MSELSAAAPLSVLVAPVSELSAALPAAAPLSVSATPVSEPSAAAPLSVLEARVVVAGRGAASQKINPRILLRGFILLAVVDMERLRLRVFLRF